MSTPHRHFALYKPFGILSQLASNDERQNRKKRFLTELAKFPEHTMPIGRLDEKSEGLLLLTTDGKLSDMVNRSGIEKEYYAQLDGQITSEAIKKLQAGVEIGIFGKKYVTKTCSAKVVADVPEFANANTRIRLNAHRENSWVRIVLTEGKFRQIRKMTAAVGYPTLRLVRTRIGAVKLGNMHVGDLREIDSEGIGLNV
ncbi:pseudouridine synthase [uncultured Croceitalea sp.]|uniref:pseudouridine synthase n=1 Tax=uncultured Croceitalea sp. TaxID=1798908 RepID=UPI003305739A